MSALAGESNRIWLNHQKVAKGREPRISNLIRRNPKITIAGIYH